MHGNLRAQHTSSMVLGAVMASIPDLSGHTAIVTGSTKGIGRAIAASLLSAGCNVVISSRHAEDAEQTARELTASMDANRTGKAIGVVCDVKSYDACAHMVSTAVREFGRVDILVNNAGIGVFAPAADITPETWRDVIGTNLDGLFFCTHAALPHLKQANGAWIINIASLAGKNAFPGGTAYNASKFGVVGFSEALMQEVRNDDIRVSYIMPGTVATEFNNHEPSEKDAWKIQPEDVAQIVVDLIAMPVRTLPSRVEVRPSRPPSK